ncbi:hypothetical protein TRVA0_037S01134 [Trichomonascus vanleenenianus]|uniref:uncharacterized protein n=1 Tax=Trichomonascus vanleenenianus TaxID=2268995 RepID=UPI003EC98B54
MQNQGHGATTTATTGSAAIMARLDAYLPTLNTGMMDVRVQDAILNYPIVRSLLVPECDLEARRRCINLITRVLNAATPVLPLILQEQTHLNGQGGRPAIPVLSLEAQAKVMTIISTMADRDRLIRFWMHHHVNNKGTLVSAGGGDKKSQLPATIALYTKIKQYKEILSDLADRIQGAICIVFWECWDEIYPTLADIVGGDEMERTDMGRIFRPSGEAAIYINKLKVERRRKLEQERRESIISQSTGSMPISMPHGRPDRSASVGSFPVASQFDTRGRSPIATSGGGQEDDSPASLMTDHSVSSSWAAGSGNHFRPGPDLQLIDSSDFNFIMEESHAADQQAASENFDAFTNISSLETHKPVPHEMLDLRRRIQMMEEGYVPEHHPSHHSDTSMEGIIW